MLASRRSYAAPQMGQLECTALRLGVESVFAWVLDQSCYWLNNLHRTFLAKKQALYGTFALKKHSGFQAAMRLRAKQNKPSITDLDRGWTCAATNTKTSTGHGGCSKHGAWWMIVDTTTWTKECKTSLAVLATKLLSSKPFYFNDFPPQRLHVI